MRVRHETRDPRQEKTVILGPGDANGHPGAAVFAAAGTETRLSNPGRIVRGGSGTKLSRKNRSWWIISVLLLTPILIAGCTTSKAATKVETKPSQEVVVHKTDAAPTLDGKAGEAFWKDIKATTIKVTDGREAQIKAAYMGDEIFMSIVWPGIPESGALRQWEFDGTQWTREYG